MNRAFSRTACIACWSSWESWIVRWIGRWALYSPEVEFLDVIGTKASRALSSCFSQSTLLTDLTPPPPPTLSQSGLRLVCNVNSQDTSTKLNVHEFRFSMVMRNPLLVWKGSYSMEASVPGVKEIMLATAQSSFMILIPASDPYSSYHLGYRTRGTRVGSFASQCLIYQRRSIMKEYWSL
jgi:hypothetical protein